MTLLERYNDFYNLECAALPSGGPISMEEMQATALESLVYAFKRKYHLDPIPAEEIVGLALQLRMQSHLWLHKLELDDTLILGTTSKSGTEKTGAEK